MKKYELVKEMFIDTAFGKLFCIRALVKISGRCEIGDLGGYVAGEKNLSQDDRAWVSGDALVSGNARVYGDALVSGNALVSGDAWVYGNALVYGDALVYGNALVYGDARVYGNALVYGDARVYGNAWVSGNARVSGDAWVSGDAQILWLSKVGSANGTLTAYPDKNGNIIVTRGCFIGTLAEFAKAVKETHGNSKIAKEYALLIKFIKLRLEQPTEAEHD